MKKKEDSGVEEFEEIPFIVALLTMIDYAILSFVGHIRDFLRKHNFEVSYLKKENEKLQVCGRINNTHQQFRTFVVEIS